MTTRVNHEVQYQTFLQNSKIAPPQFISFGEFKLTSSLNFDVMDLNICMLCHICYGKIPFVQ